MTTVEDLDDLLQLVETVERDAEKVLKSLQIPARKWSALKIQTTFHLGTHKEHAAGTSDPDLRVTAASILKIGDEIRWHRSRIGDEPESATACIGSLMWNLHLAHIAIHRDQLKKAISYRPDQQAHKRKGQFGLTHYVMEEAQRSGCSTPANVLGWLNDNTRVPHNEKFISVVKKGNGWDFRYDDEPPKHIGAPSLPQTWSRFLRSQKTSA